MIIQFRNSSNFHKGFWKVGCIYLKLRLEKITKRIVEVDAER